MQHASRVVCVACGMRRVQQARRGGAVARRAPLRQSERGRHSARPPARARPPSPPAPQCARGHSSPTPAARAPPPARRTPSGPCARRDRRGATRAPAHRRRARARARAPSRAPPTQRSLRATQRAAAHHLQGTGRVRGQLKGLQVDGGCARLALTHRPRIRSAEWGVLPPPPSRGDHAGRAVSRGRACLAG